jgi:hypothetical protein
MRLEYCHWQTYDAAMSSDLDDLRLRFHHMKPLDLVSKWPSPDSAFVVRLRLRAQPNPHRALGLRVQ